MDCITQNWHDGSGLSALPFYRAVACELFLGTACYPCDVEMEGRISGSRGGSACQ